MAFDLASVLKDVPDLGTNREQIEYIDLDLIDEDPNNFYQLSKVEELADNIATCGLQQPIRVRRHPGTKGRYMIVSGHRRRAALQILTKEEPEKWQEVPCIVESASGSDALQQLKVIYGNSSTRVMTAAEISEQAVQVEKLLYQLKEEGHEFPGRMRDHVAQVVQVSKSKLSRLKVIREKLSPPWFRRFQKNELKESVAYALAQIKPEYQVVIYEGLDAVGRLSSLYESDVLKIFQRLEKIETLSCEKNKGTPCANIHRKMIQSTQTFILQANKCVKCCNSCPELISCKNACPNLADKVKKLKEDARYAKQQARAAQVEKDRPQIEQIQNLYLRFGYLREKAGKTVKEVFQAADMYCSLADQKNIPEREAGTAKISTKTKLPYDYSCYLADVNRYIALADLFGCSIDYMLCRTDYPDLVHAAPVESVPTPSIWWQTGEPVNLGQYVVILGENRFSSMRTAIYQWTGERWEESGIGHDDDIDGNILGWVPMPEGLAYG